MPFGSWDSDVAVRKPGSPNTGRAFESAFEAALAVPLGVVVGYYLDRWLGTEPILLFVFLLLGFATSVRKLLAIQWPSSNDEGADAQSRKQKRE